MDSGCQLERISHAEGGMYVSRSGKGTPFSPSLVLSLTPPLSITSRRTHYRRFAWPIPISNLIIPPRSSKLSYTILPRNQFTRPGHRICQGAVQQPNLEHRQCRFSTRYHVYIWHDAKKRIDWVGLVVAPLRILPTASLSSQVPSVASNPRC